MKKSLTSIFLLVLLTFAAHVGAGKVWAAVNCSVDAFTNSDHTSIIQNIPLIDSTGTCQYGIDTLYLHSIQPENNNYHYVIDIVKSSNGFVLASGNVTPAAGANNGYSAQVSLANIAAGSLVCSQSDVVLVVYLADSSNNKLCTVQNSKQYPFIVGNNTCSVSSQACKGDDGKITVSFSGNYSNFNVGTTYYVKEDLPALQKPKIIPIPKTTTPNGSFQVGEYLDSSIGAAYSQSYCVTSVGTAEVDPCSYSICNTTVSVDANIPLCKDVPQFPSPPPGDGKESPFSICQQAGENKGLCDACFNDKQGIWTAVGCIPTTNSTAMVRAFINLGLGIGGGVVTLMVLAGGFLLSTSQGDPKRVEEAKAMVSSAVMGLVFVIFSITILRFIGVSVLRIPGFGS